MQRKRRGYLKHFNDATTGDTIRQCLLKKEPYAVVLFWLILETCNKKNSHEGAIEIDLLSSIMCVRTDKLLSIISRSSRLLPDLSLNLLGSKLHFSASNYAEYQDSRSTNNARIADQSLPIKDNRLKIKDKRCNLFLFFSEGKRITQSSQLMDFLDGLTVDVMQHFTKKYPELNPRDELKRIFIHYKNVDSDYFPKSDQHWMNVAKKWFERRQQEIDDLKARGLKEVWGSNGSVSHHRI